MQKESGKKEEIPSSVRELLKFEDICPIWASKLRIGLDEQDVKTLAHDSKYCIVGEAWGCTGRQTGYYIAPLIPFVGCWECVKFGRTMGKIVKENGQTSAAGHLQPMISNFVEHWNEKHSRYRRTQDSAQTRKELRFRSISRF
jgi:hypothetical protein